MKLTTLEEFQNLLWHAEEVTRQTRMMTWQ